MGPLVHSWADEDGFPVIKELVEKQSYAIAGTAMPKAVIRKRAKAFEWSSLQTPGWKLMKSPSAVVRGDAPVDELRAASALAEEMNVILRTAIGGYEDIPLYSIRLFSDAQDFRRYAVRSGAPNAEAFYDPRSAELVMWFGAYATPELVQRSFGHEFTHAYMDRVFRVTEPLWFAEGMAEYFSNLTWRNGMLISGQLSWMSISLLELKPPVPFSEFLMMGRDVFYSRDFAFFYAQAWAIVLFLFQRHPDVITQALQNRTQPDIRSWSLENEWLEFLRDLLTEHSRIA